MYEYGTVYSLRGVQALPGRDAPVVGRASEDHQSSGANAPCHAARLMAPNERAAPIRCGLSAAQTRHFVYTFRLLTIRVGVRLIGDMVMCSF